MPLKDVLSRPLVNYFKVVPIILLFLLLAFNPQLGEIYILIMLVDFWWFVSDNFISFDITSSRPRYSTSRVILETFVALIGFIGISMVFVSGAGTQSVFQLLATATPVLKDNMILTLFAWGFFVPLIETSFFNGRLLEGLTTYTKELLKYDVSVNRFSIGLFGIIFFVAALFTLFHFTAKGLESAPLLITFLFSVISSVLVIRHQELRGAILLHVIVNSAAVISSPAFKLF